MQAKVYRKKISSIIQTFLRWWENVPRLLTASVRTCASPCPRELETHCWDAIYPGIVILPLHSWTSDDGIDCAAREKSATAHPVMRMETTCAKNHNESKDIKMCTRTSKRPVGPVVHSLRLPPKHAYALYLIQPAQLPGEGGLGHFLPSCAKDELVHFCPRQLGPSPLKQVYDGGDKLRVLQGPSSPRRVRLGVP